MPKKPEQLAFNFEKKHVAAQTKLERRVAALYEAAIQEVTAMAQLQTLPAGKFSLSKLPALSAKVEQAIAELSSGLEATIRNGIADAWELSNEKNNQIFDHRIDRTLLPDSVTAQFYNPNQDALERFTNRKTKGMNLSDRVWDLSQGFRGELERSLGEGIATGKSADRMSRDIRQALKNPDALFRRVRNAEGKLQLSKAAANYHPGQGVYRSSYKNAMRVTRTETNMAYRSADLERYQQTPFVLGFEVKLSNNHPKYDICDGLAGKYPVDFKYVGWHPHCRCYLVPIMSSDAEYDKYEAALLAGNEKGFKFSGRVEEPHAGFNKWIQGNQERIGKLKAPPYFLRDNPGYVNAGMLPVKPAASKIVKIAPAKVVKDPVVKKGKFELDEKTLEKLENNGWLLDVDDRKLAINTFNKNLKGFDLNEIESSFKATELKYPGLKWNDKFITVPPGKDSMVVFSIMGTYKGEMVNLDRSFTAFKGIKTVSHDYFRIPEALQGKGLSKDILGGFFKQYENSGISKIEVTANLTIGGYTWAKYGFAAPERFDVLYILREAANNDLIKPNQLLKLQNTVKAWYDKTPSDPFPMRLIAELGQGTNDHYGKTILIGKQWTGTLNMKNEAQVRTFKEYLNKKK